MDVVTATSLMKSCVECISKYYRTSGYNDALMKANELAEILGIEKSSIIYLGREKEKDNLITKANMKSKVI